MDILKTVVFENLAKELYKTRQDGKKTRMEGFAELAEGIAHQALGIITAVGALGYDTEEFQEYYKSNRPRYRDEEKASGNDLEVLKKQNGVLLVKLEQKDIYEVRSESTGKTLWNTFDYEKAERMYAQELEDLEKVKYE